MKILLLLMALLYTQANAAPFIYPDHWFEKNTKSPKPGGTIRVAQWIDYKTFNPFLISATDDIASQMASGAGLFMLDPSTKKYIPLMAREMPAITNKGTRFTVKLRRNMRFSDGQYITADDFVTTYKIHSDKEVGSSALRTLVMGDSQVKLKKIDKFTLQFDFPYEVATAYQKMSLAPWPDHIFGPVYKESGAKGIISMWNLNTSPKTLVSPGAWVLQTFSPGQKAIFAKNRYFGYWNRDSKGRHLPYAAFLSRKILLAETGLLDFIAGNQDFTEPRKSSDLAAIQKAIQEKNIKAKLLPNVSAHNRVFFISFNWNKAKALKKQKLFRDPNFRKAMSHFTNRKAMVNLALGNMGTVTYTSVSPAFKNYQFKNTPKYPYNPTKGLQLLGELGYNKKNKQGDLINEKGETIEFNIATMNDPVYERMTRIFADDLKKFGISARVHVIDIPTILSLIDSSGTNRNWDAIMLSFSVFRPEFPYFATHMGCGSAEHFFNRSGEGNCLTQTEASIARVFDKGEKMLDDQQRQKVGEQLSKLVAEQQATIYIASPNYHISYNKRIGGWYKKKYIDSISGPSPYGFITNFFQ